MTSALPVVHALSIVHPAVQRILDGSKRVEIRSWQPGTLPLRDLLLVENRRYLREEDEVDPEGHALALVDVVGIRPWTPEDAGATGSQWAEGYFCWELDNARPVLPAIPCPARRGLYAPGIALPPDAWLPPVPDIADPALDAALRHRIDNKTKPLGALGRLEALALRIGAVLGSAVPALRDPQLVVCAADHGLAAQGVSAYPSDVTWQMVGNFLAGGAAVSVLARQHGIALTVADCGVRRPFPAPAASADPLAPRLVDRRIAAGTADSLHRPAMTAGQCAQAIRHGIGLVRGLPGNAVLLGEMGIGNTSAAALLLARLAGLPAADCAGAGTGLDADGLARKVAVLERVLARHPEATAPLEALAAFGGFEIATLVGVVLQAAQERRVVVVDGFITTAAVLVAQALRPAVRQRCVFSHRSGERGHAAMLAHLGAEPLLDLGLRLGEGSGAALAWPLLQSACAVLQDMASFEDAGVSRADEEGAGPALSPP